MKAEMPWASTNAGGRERGAPPKYYGTDTGCSLHPSCLACPRPVCRYDDETRLGGRPPLFSKEPSLDAGPFREGPSR